MNWQRFSLVALLAIVLAGLAVLVTLKAPAASQVAIVPPFVGAVVLLVGAMKSYLDKGGGGGAAVLLFCAAFLFGQAACKPTQQQIDAGGVAVTAGCALIEAITGDGSVRTVCATLDELVDLVKDILAHRPDGGGPLMLPAKCRDVGANGVTVCATEEEIAAAIDRLTTKQAAAFVRVK